MCVGMWQVLFGVCVCLCGCVSLCGFACVCCAREVGKGCRCAQEIRVDFKYHGKKFKNILGKSLTKHTLGNNTCQMSKMLGFQREILVN